MSVKHVMTQMKNPMNRSEKKYYACAIDSTDFSEITRKVAQSSSAMKGDVLLVLDGLIFETISDLPLVRIVGLSEFGTFQMSISSGGSEAVENFNHDLIKKSSRVFRLGGLLKGICSNVTYEALDRRIWPEKIRMFLSKRFAV